MADILVVAAHPDDAELNVAGTILKHRALGHSVAICDLTRGERGSRGSAELRQLETDRANRLLGIAPDERWNLEIPDGGITTDDAHVLRLVRAIRHFRPQILLFPWERDRHPDHEAANRLVRRANFDAGLRAIATEHGERPQEPFRPARLYTFMQAYERQPDFIVDISEHFEAKLDAIAAYSSQFTVPGRRGDDRLGEPQTFISGTEFMEAIIARMRHWGFQIGARYGEAFCTETGPLSIGDLTDTL